MYRCLEVCTIVDCVWTSGCLEVSRCRDKGISFNVCRYPDVSISLQVSRCLDRGVWMSRGTSRGVDMFRGL